MISITDLLTVYTADQIVASITTQLVALSVPADQWRSGGTYSTIRRVFANLFAGFSTTLSAAIGSFFLPTAMGGWLDLLAFYVFGVSRTPATAASGSLQLQNNGGGVFSGPTYAPGQVVFANSSTGQKYTNTQQITLAALGSQTITVAANLVGAIGSSPPSGIDTIVSPSMPGVKVTNPASLIGLDAMSDPDLRNLCIASRGAQSVRGPRTAFQYAVAKATRLDGSPVNINRVAVSPASHTGTTTVTIASPSGVADPADITAVATSIEAIARPGSTTAVVQSAVAAPYQAAITIWILSTPGINPTAIKAEAAADLDVFIKAYPIGGITGALYGTGVDGVLKSSDASIFRVDGATDLLLAPGQVATNNTSIATRVVQN